MKPRAEDRNNQSKHGSCKSNGDSLQTNRVPVPVNTMWWREASERDENKAGGKAKRLDAAPSYTPCWNFTHSHRQQIKQNTFSQTTVIYHHVKLSEAKSLLRLPRMKWASKSGRLTREIFSFLSLSLLRSKGCSWYDQPEQRQSLPGLFVSVSLTSDSSSLFLFWCSPSFLHPPSKERSITKGEHLEMDARVWITILINPTSAGRNGGLKQKAEHFTATGGSNQERQHWELCLTAHNHIKWHICSGGKHAENKHEMVCSSLAPLCALFFSLICLYTFTFCMRFVCLFQTKKLQTFSNWGRSDLKGATRCRGEVSENKWN